ncbi:MAG TPA: TMEM175 family protein [Sphingomonas sp.]|jgi:uncharacterized membrane protein|nr:TMEM175 family protein [Sphingomonas sp.]
MLDTQGSERKTDRAEAFSDAVLAIAITLPLVDLKSPGVEVARPLAAQYAALEPHYAAYGLGFVVIGLYWAYSHFSGKLLVKTDHGFNLLTLVFLAAVSLTPLPARPFVEHLGDAGDAATAASIYAWMLAAPAVLWAVRWYYAVRRGLLSPHLTPDYIHATNVKYTAIAAACVVGALIATFAMWQAGIAIVGLVTLSFALPPMMPRYKDGEAPADDIEEADEQHARERDV